MPTQRKRRTTKPTKNRFLFPIIHTNPERWERNIVEIISIILARRRASSCVIGFLVLTSAGLLCRMNFRIDKGSIKQYNMNMIIYARWIMISSLVKRLKIVAAVILTPILVCIVGLMLTACSPQDIKYDKAISIAKKDFGCEKILWIGSSATVLSGDSWDKIKDKIGGTHYSFYVVGEKDGEEVYIIIPSPQIKDPFITTWALGYSFKQVVEKFNENGAQYVIDVPDDYYSRQFTYIDLRAGISLNGLAEYYDVGCDDEAFRERLDVEAVFEYIWEEDGNEYCCIVTQENGELKAYKKMRDN